MSNNNKQTSKKQNKGSKKSSPNKSYLNSRGNKAPKNLGDLWKDPRGKKTILLTLLLILFCAFVFRSYSTVINDMSTDQLKTNEFISAIEQDRVISVVYNPKDYTVTGEYYPAISAGAGISNAFNSVFDTLNYQLSLHKGSDGMNLSGVQTEIQKPQNLYEKTKYASIFIGQDTLVALLLQHPNTQYVIEMPNSFFETIVSYLPLILMGLFFIYFISQVSKASSNQFGFGKIKARKTSEERPKVMFSDIAGIDEAVEDMSEVKDFLANPRKYQSIGAKIPKGVLLVGSPGTGKTLLAKAVAGEAGVPFFSISGSDFVEMFVGVGASRVRDLFKQAKAAQPSIIFIDEIDAVGRQRGAGLGGGHDEREQTLNQLLVEMDGFDENQSVVLIAATNRVDILDPALLRPGRFDRQIIVDTPDVKGREKILKVHSKNKPLGSDVDVKKIAQLTSGFTGADLANLINEAALLTARYNKKIISMKIVTESMERVVAGPERKSRMIDNKTKDIISFHECGHALVGHKLENTDPVHKISIISRGRALGYTMSIPEEDKVLQSKNEMLDNLAMFLAGRAAEEIFCDDITTGASNDLERATKVARAIVTQYGMSEALGIQTYGEQNQEVFLGRNYSERKQDYSDKTASRIDEEINHIMVEAYKRAHNILIQNKEHINLMHDVLLDRETVDGLACDALLNNKWEEYLENEDEINKKLAEKEKAARKNDKKIYEDYSKKMKKSDKEKKLQNKKDSKFKLEIKINKSDKDK